MPTGSNAQVVEVIAGGAGIAKVVEVVVGGALVANELINSPMQFTSPAQRIADGRKVFEAQLAADSHAVAKHGADAYRAYAETANPSPFDIYECSDGRTRIIKHNWKEGQVSLRVVDPDGTVVTAFRAKREYVEDALKRDGCDNGWNGGHPVAVPQAQKTRTPTALELLNERVKAEREKK